MSGSAGSGRPGISPAAAALARNLRPSPAVRPVGPPVPDLDGVRVQVGIDHDTITLPRLPCGARFTRTQLARLLEQLAEADALAREQWRQLEPEQRAEDANPPELAIAARSHGTFMGTRHVRGATPAEGGPLHFGRCYCGWEGPSRLERSAAVRDCEDHLAEALGDG